MAITQKEMDAALSIDTILINRIEYIEKGTFIEDKKLRIQSYLDSEFLGDSMRSHLGRIKDLIDKNPEEYKQKKIEELYSQKIENDKLLLEDIKPEDLEIELNVG